MFRLIESIRLENGSFARLHYHQQRMDKTILQLTENKNTICLAEELRKQSLPDDGLYKCRVVYSAENIIKIGVIPYHAERPLAMKVVRHDSIEYPYKFEDRQALEELKPDLPHTDIIIIKKGLVTDALYSNLIFFDGHRWFTPAQPLLKGTMRQALLDAGAIHEDVILEKDIKKFSYIKRINAMLQTDEPPLPVTQIIW